MVSSRGDKAGAQIEEQRVALGGIEFELRTEKGAEDGKGFVGLYLEPRFLQLRGDPTACRLIRVLDTFCAAAAGAGASAGPVGAGAADGDGLSGAASVMPASM